MFPFNQEEKTKDCGYRCLYYVLAKYNGWEEAYSEWLNQFRFFAPVKTGIYFNDICTVLDYYNLEYRFTQLDDKALYIVYSGIWLHPEGKKHGHYFVYDEGIVYCSTHSEPYKMPLNEVLPRLEAKTIDHAFRCVKILGVKDGKEDS